MSHKLKDFSYHLPLELIAQQPVEPRDHSRLLVLEKTSGQIFHKQFFNIIDFLHPKDILVLNNSKVFPARLIGHKAKTGGAVEIFLHQRKTVSVWECLIGGRIKVGLEIIISNKLRAKIIKNNEDGTWLVEFNLSGNQLLREISRIGLVPLPPYIKRVAALEKEAAQDKKRYQTVFAARDKIGSVAAPTAGLHFTNSLLAKIKAKGVKVAFITLHVGLGTFASVKTNNIKDHKMHSEYVEISRKTWQEIIKSKKSGGRVIAVGTTSCRSLESAAKSLESTAKSLESATSQLDGSLTKSKIRLKTKSPQVDDSAFWTDIFIYPGYKFKIIDGLVTNFHLPESTLLMLVSALAGQKQIKKAYQEAIIKRYRFFSYGDAMFIN